MVDRALAAWGRQLRALAAPTGPLGVVARVASAVVEATTGTAWPAVPPALRLARFDVSDVSPAPLPAGVEPAPELLGVAYEALLSTASRRGGAHYTPRDVAARLAVVAIDASTADRPVVCDPAVGGGAFLLAAGRAFAARGFAPVEIVDELLFGADIDPAAAAVAEAALSLWAAPDSQDGRPSPNVVAGDVLRHGRSVWPSPRSFDVVVGNPPFQSPLGADTGRDHATEARVRARFGAGVRAYSDTAALFMLAALDLVDDGVVLLVQPTSMLAARDAAGVRAAIAERATVEGFWYAGEAVFAAEVSVCAPLLRAGCSSARPVRRWRGRGVVDAAPAAVFDPAASTWGALVRGLASPAPIPLVSSAKTMGDWCRATAGFRDEYYGLVPAVLEHADRAGRGATAPLVTAGVIDPARCRWGERPVRFGRRKWDAPVVAVDELPPALSRWVAARRHPKVVVAAQTRVVEAAVDASGDWVPSVPVLSVHCDAADVWRVAAALLAPPVSAWALDRWPGAALLDDCIKLAAANVAELPAPLDASAWDAAESLVREAAAAPDDASWRAALAVLASTMSRAYGLRDDDPVVGWWLGRLPRA